MIFTVKFQVLRNGHPRTIETGIAGCTDAHDAEQKLRKLYSGIVKVVSVKPK